MLRRILLAGAEKVWVADSVGRTLKVFLLPRAPPIARLHDDNRDYHTATRALFAIGISRNVAGPGKAPGTHT
jgi:hypothetical protein